MNDSVTLMAVGDIMLSENRGTGKKISRYGPEYPFLKSKGLLQKADILFGNLEAPLSSRGVPYPRQNSHTTFRATPESVEGLTACHFDIVSLANNHATDYGGEALLDSIGILERHGIHYVGAGRNRQEAERTVILERNGIRIAFLACSSFIMFATKLASRSQAGIAHFNPRMVKRGIERARRAADIVVVSIHWGLDFTEHPVPFQMVQARELIDCGAHIILGHHSHYLQGMEHYKHGIIAYSLGDFIFDEPGRETCILKLKISRTGVEKTEILPARITDELQTEPVVGPEGAGIIQKIDSLSDAYTRYDPLRASQMIDDFIIANIYIFLKSGNVGVLRNLTSHHVIMKTLTLPARKILRKLAKIFGAIRALS